MSETSIFIIIGGAAIFGATILYFFYYFRTHKKDTAGLKEKSEEEAQPSYKSPHESLKDSHEKPSPPPTPLEAPPTPTAPPPPPEKAKDLQEVLFNTRHTLWGRIKGSLIGERTLSPDDMDSLEEILYTSDLGPNTVQRLVGAVGESLAKSEKCDVQKVREALRSEMISIFGSLDYKESNEISQLLKLNSEGPQVWMIVGVNGAGKTTTIGKLAYQVVQSGKRVMVVAGDTFRAAADEQLKIWSDRAKVELFNPPHVTDPSAVAFDACSSARSKNFDVVIVDTAGRLHTQEHLMEELKKMRRVIQKVLPKAPHEVFVVLDANSGQNALLQAKSFNEAVSLTGAILTKLDGSAKGGVAVGLACELKLPIKLIGVGEKLGDLRPFHSKEFVNSII